MRSPRAVSEYNFSGNVVATPAVHSPEATSGGKDLGKRDLAILLMSKERRDDRITQEEGSTRVFGKEVQGLDKAQERP